MKLKNTKGFKCDVERRTHSYEGEGNRIEREIPLKTIIGMDNSLVSLSVDLEYKGNQYSFSLESDGRTTIERSRCGEKLISLLLKRLSLDTIKKEGLHKISFHLFRHTFPKKWILAGGDIFRLQKILDHTSLTGKRVC